MSRLHRVNTPNVLRNGVSRAGVFNIKPETITFRDTIETHERAEAQTWRNILQKDNEGQLIFHIRRVMRSMIVAKLSLTWESYMDTNYAHDMAKYCDIRQIAKFRAWWGLNLLVDEARRSDQKRDMLYASALVATEKAKKAGGSPPKVPSLGISNERIAKIREYVLTHLTELAPH